MANIHITADEARLVSVKNRAPFLKGVLSRIDTAILAAASIGKTEVEDIYRKEKGLSEQDQQYIEGHLVNRGYTVKQGRFIKKSDGNYVVSVQWGK